MMTATSPIARKDNAPSDFDLPILFEDDGYEEMGESLAHSETEAIVRFGLMAHLHDRPELVVLSDMNLHYHPLERAAYVSPDVMVVQPTRAIEGDLASYRVGEDGPMPILTVEVLSKRTYQQQDLAKKMEVYRRKGVAEYIVVDITQRFLKEGIQLRRRRKNGKWVVHQDEDRGVTSELGFRVRIMPDGAVRVFDVPTGRGYPRPEEADLEAAARLDAERARDRAEARAARQAKARRKAEERALASAQKLAELEARNAQLREQLRRLGHPQSNGDSH